MRRNGYHGRDGRLKIVSMMYGSSYLSRMHDFVISADHHHHHRHMVRLKPPFPETRSSPPRAGNRRPRGRTPPGVAFTRRPHQRVLNKILLIDNRKLK